MILDLIGGRKALQCFIALAIGVAITFAKGDVPPNMEHLLVYSLGFFVGGNVVEHVKEGIIQTVGLGVGAMGGHEQEEEKPVSMTPPGRESDESKT